MLHSSSASSLPSCNTEQACSIKQHACVQKLAVDNTKSVHNRSKLTVFVRTAQGLSSNQNEAAINSKSDLFGEHVDTSKTLLHNTTKWRGCIYSDTKLTDRKET